MRQWKWIVAGVLLLACSGRATAHCEERRDVTAVQAEMKMGGSSETLDAVRERQALKILFESVRKQIVSAAEAMPAVKYGFVPTEGEFKGVRSFGQQVKHLSATNHILAAASLGEESPTDAGDEMGPENVRTKEEIIQYLNESFAHLGRAIDLIGEDERRAKGSPISPMSAKQKTRLSLTVESLIHAFNHYGQMVEYLRMNGVVPPASLP